MPCLPQCAVSLDQVQSGIRMIVFSFDKLGKYNMLGMHLDQNFHDLITNQKVLPYWPAAATSCMKAESEDVRIIRTFRPGSDRRKQAFQIRFLIIWKGNLVSNQFQEAF